VTILFCFQDISDESDAEYTTQTQYTQIKTSNTSMDSMVVVNSPQIYRQQGVSRVPTHQDLNQSVGSKTGAVASISCPHCDKKFMRGYNMRVHIDRVHNKVRVSSRFFSFTSQNNWFKVSLKPLFSI